MKGDLTWAIGVAIEGRKHLAHWWETEASKTYPRELCEERRSEIAGELDRLRILKKALEKNK